MSAAAASSKGRKAAKAKAKAEATNAAEVATRPASGIPAKGTRPPFTGGNAAGLTGGHRSPRVYGEVASLLAAGLLAERPDLEPFPEAVAAWATAEAQAALLRRHLDAVGLIDPKTNEPRQRLLDNIRATERSAAKLRVPLGLDPLAEAQLARERAAAATTQVNLGAIMAAGHAALAGHTAPLDATPSTGTGGTLDGTGTPSAPEALPAATAGIPTAPTPDVAGDVLARVAAEGRARMEAEKAAWAEAEARDARNRSGDDTEARTDDTDTDKEATP